MMRGAAAGALAGRQDETWESSRSPVRMLRDQDKTEG